MRLFNTISQTCEPGVASDVSLTRSSVLRLEVGTLIEGAIESAAGNERRSAGGRRSKTSIGPSIRGCRLAAPDHLVPTTGQANARTYSRTSSAVSTPLNVAAHAPNTEVPATRGFRSCRTAIAANRHAETPGPWASGPGVSPTHPRQSGGTRPRHVRLKLTA